MISRIDLLVEFSNYSVAASLESNDSLQRICMLFFEFSQSSCVIGKLVVLFTVADLNVGDSLFKGLPVARVPHI